MRYDGNYCFECGGPWDGTHTNAFGEPLCHECVRECADDDERVVERQTHGA